MKNQNEVYLQLLSNIVIGKGNTSEEQQSSDHPNSPFFFFSW
jgi:hypothetical protein